MTWTKNFLTAVLLASSLSLGQTRALPVAASNDRALSGQSLEDLTALLRRFDDAHDHNFDGSVSHWSRRDHQLPPSHDIRAITPPKIIDPTVPKTGPDVPVTGPKNPTDPNTSPDNNPGAGLDPTKPNPQTTTPGNDPGAGLDPTKPKPDPEPVTPPESAPPTTPNTPADGTLQLPNGPGKPQLNPETAPAELNVPGCGNRRKRADCGTSDAFPDHPDSPPDTSAPTRDGRPPKTDFTTKYDYYAEVINEQGTGLVNDKLERLAQTIAARGENKGQVRTDGINEQFNFGTAAGPMTVDNAFFTPKYMPFKLMMDPFEITPTDTRLFQDTLTSKGHDKATSEVAWTQDQKYFWDDQMHAREDRSTFTPAMTSSEKRMAIMQKNNIDPKKIQFLSQSGISNSQTEETMRSIFTKLSPDKTNANNDAIAVTRDPEFPDQAQAFDAYFRTPNGEDQLTNLEFYAKDWGYRAPQVVMMSRIGPLEEARYDVTVFLGV